MAITPVAQSDTLDTWRTTLNTTIARWNILGESSSIVISGGTINGTTIGGTTPAPGTFTNLTVSSTIDLSIATLILADNAISGDKISGGTAELDYAVLSNDPSSGDHAIRKSYLDTQLQTQEDQSIAFAIVFGG